jgi:hypothetical protein
VAAIGFPQPLVAKHWSLPAEDWHPLSGSDHRAALSSCLTVRRGLGLARSRASHPFEKAERVGQPYLLLFVVF